MKALLKRLQRPEGTLRDGGQWPYLSGRQGAWDRRDNLFTATAHEMHVAFATTVYDGSG
jgi:hypothetical protein